MDRYSTAGQLAASFTLLLATTAASAFQIVQLTPQGEVAQVRQVVAKFDAPAIRFGDAKAADPLTLSCNDAGASKGQGRWNSDKEWIFEFARDLPPGVRCTAQARSGLAAVNGDALKGNSRFEFATGGPFVTRIQPSYGRIDEDQFFILQLNGPATLQSLQDHVWCTSDTLGERIPVRLITGKPRDELLASRGLAGPAANEPLRYATLACNRTLSPASRGQLVYGQGVATPSGLPNKVEKRFDFQVREPFSASFSCERENAQAACLPIRPMRLEFNASVPRKLAKDIRLKAGDKSYAPDLSEDGDDSAAFVGSVRFTMLFPESTSFVLELPKDLRDDAGRSLRNADNFPLKVATGPMPPLAKFAAAPFGIVERFAEPGMPPLLPVTLRKVEAKLLAQSLPVGATQPASAPGNGKVSDLQPQTDAEIIAWMRKVKRYDQFFVSRKGAAQDVNGPLPPSVTDSDRNYVQSRMVSLLKGRNGVKTLDMPVAQADDPRPFEVVGIPLSPGFHVLEIESARLGTALLDEKFGAERKFFVRTSTLVTNMGVHFKHGRENSVAWVTSLDKGKPVAGAVVRVSDCAGKPVASATTDGQGIARFSGIAAEAPNCRALDGEGDDYRNAWFVSARAAGTDGVQELAFTWSDWQRGIEPWRFDVPTSRAAQPDTRVHTVLDRNLLRAGETLSMKHLMRFETREGFATPADGPDTLVITHTGSGQTFSQPLAWRKTATGGLSAESTWQAPPAGKLGVYDINLQQGKAEGGRSYGSGQFRVEEFRLPVLQGRIATAGKGPLVDVRSVATDVQLNFVSGGPAANLPVRVSALVRERGIVLKDYDNFSFSPPRPERVARTDRGDDYDGEEEATASQDQRVVANKMPLTLDKNGTGKLTIADLKPSKQPQDLILEATYADPSGEVQTLRSSTVLWPAAVMVGIKAESWASVKQKAVFQTLALDLSGKPVAGVPLDVKAIARIVTSSRKRMVGGFYSYDNQTTTKDLGTVCSGQSDTRGLLQCAAQIDQPGEIELVVTARDKDQRSIQAASSIYITKAGELWFGGENHDRMDLLAERKSYQPGETARFQVRMPFRYATALLAIEREGVIETRVVELNGKDPTIDVEIKPGWAPNVYVSVLALRGRLRDVPWYSFFTWGFKAPREWWTAFWYEGREYVAPTALVDLSKPAYRLGMAEIRVGAQAHQLNVTVKADKESYPVRGQAKVTISATRPDGKPAANAEVALAAVDQALLELSPNTSWNLLEAMLQRRSWGVETSTAQMEIIGRRHYGRKAVAAGGGGGRSPTRELLDTLLLWNPRVQLDAQGQASITVPLNDALTSFKIVAVADAEAGLFGTGQTSIRSTQDLQIISGLPPLVREDDQFRAQFTLRNTSARAMKIEVAPRATLL
ncbi:MAG: MG2 domain-containing protein, partial [Pseudomonadota bacterium]